MNAGAQQLRAAIDDALRYWEPRRMLYNLLLGALVLGWLIVTWPHLRAALTLQSLLLMFVLAVLANVCYCAAYAIDIPLQLSSFRGPPLAPGPVAYGVLFAAILASYWVADEIYPYVPATR
ncbi:MAG TPA: hypothetical protein VL176_09880 [Steroidobacteraceae bacterium]|nr:hypothetical protein [Steroidobacteraceae bacterium]